jgi:hypothetical protein
MTAKNEGIDVYALQITASGSTAGSVNSLELWFDTGTSAFATATTTGCGADETFSSTGNNGASVSATFCAKMQSQQLKVPKNQDVKILVKANMKDDTQGATTNQRLQFLVDNTKAFNNATGSGAVRARGLDSSNDLAANDGDTLGEGEVFIGVSTAAASNVMVRGVLHVSTLSKIASIVDAYPAGSSAVPTGASDLGMFKISAASNVNAQNGYNKVVMSGVIFNVTANNVAIDASTFVFYNTANSTVTSACTARTVNGLVISSSSSASGSFLVDCRALPASSVNVTVDPSTDMTFSLKGTVTNNKIVGTNTSTLQVSIQNLESISRGVYATSNTDSHFQWRDKDDSSSFTGSNPDKFNWVEFPTTFVNSRTFTN